MWQRHTNKKKTITPLTHFSPVSHFYTPWKKKTYGFLTFSGGIEMCHWTKMAKETPRKAPLSWSL